MRKSQELTTENGSGYTAIKRSNNRFSNRSSMHGFSLPPRGVASLAMAYSERDVRRDCVQRPVMYKRDRERDRQTDGRTAAFDAVSTRGNRRSRSSSSPFRNWWQHCCTTNERPLVVSLSRAGPVTWNGLPTAVREKMARH